MSNIFQNVVTSRKKYNNFNLGREVLLSGQIGKLIPVQCDEVVPGDHFQQSAAFLTRFAPLSAPAMARFNVHFHTFYVPFRIITPETSRESTYERFIKSIGKHSSEVPVLPHFFGDGTATPLKPFTVGTLYDYLGFPTDCEQIFEEARISALPFLAYQRIYQDFYRRDQIEPEVVYPSNFVGVDVEEGPTTTLNGDYPELEDGQLEATIADLFKLQTRNYERDYFTSALPSPQFGDEVSIGDGIVNWIGDTSLTGDMTLIADDYPMQIYQTTGFNSGQNNAVWLNDNGTTYLMNPSSGSTPYAIGSNIKGSFNMNITDTSGIELKTNPITVNEFRLAMQLQGLKEQINRVGTRYLEIMEGIYNVRVPDARLQRPIYLGGFKNSVTIGSVMQTSESDKTPQGTLTGQMSAAGSDRLVNGGYEFKEHGYLMTIMSITPRTSYYGGMPRKFTKIYPEEFYLPAFDHLGEQEIYNSELYVGVELYGDFRTKAFGYTPHYAELKSAHSTVHGEFRTTLANWHVSRSFDEQPNLNAEFIKAEPQDFDRIFEFQDVANTSNEHFYMQIYFDVRAKRNMSKYSTPYTLY